MGEPEWQVEDSPWGHASGWAQLSGKQHNVSCVVLGLVDPTRLAGMFDSLSDALTEAGYPWEVLMIDVGASRSLSGLLGAWCGRQGFRRIALPADTPPAAALAIGLERARGDAVLLTTARSGVLVPSIPQMVTQWSEGLEIVRATWVDSFDAHEPVPASVRNRSTGGESNAPPGAAADSLGGMLGEEALLLDRQAVKSLLEGR
ncbi:MAG: hypothetical protein ABL916_18750 [Burkholderiaceae bacterium]